MSSFPSHVAGIYHSRRAKLCPLLNCFNGLLENNFCVYVGPLMWSSANSLLSKHGRLKAWRNIFRAKEKKSGRNLHRSSFWEKTKKYFKKKHFQTLPLFLFCHFFLKLLFPFPSFSCSRMCVFLIFNCLKSIPSLSHRHTWALGKGLQAICFSQPILYGLSGI